MFSKAQEWVLAKDPLHFDRPEAGVGPGLTFGKLLADADPGIRIGLIPCAVGGSSILSWEPGKTHPLVGASGRTRPYDDAMVRAKEALKRGVLKGILWHQGETDRGTPVDYAAKFTELVARLRNDLDSPSVPVIAGELAWFINFQKIPTNNFNAVLQGMVGSIRNYEVVSSSGFGKVDTDDVHFDAISARKLGERFAEKMVRLNVAPVAAWDLTTLVATRTRTRTEGEADLALRALLAKAASALSEPDVAVTHKSRFMTPGGVHVPSPSADPHNYVSIATYSWPFISDPPQVSDAEKAWVNRDGDQNTFMINQSDYPRLKKMTDRIETFVMAWWFGGESKYAEAAVKQLRVWFNDPATRMNPHLQHAQFIPNSRTQGSGSRYGIIDARGFVSMLSAVALLERENCIPLKDRIGLRVWFRSYLEWLNTSDFGIQEKNADNNHGVLFDLQAFAGAAYVGDMEERRDIISRFINERIGKQIQPDGRLPRELDRPDGAGYASFTINAMVQMMILARVNGDDLYKLKLDDGRSLQVAVEWFMPFIDGNPWPYNGDFSPVPSDVRDALTMLASITKDPKVIDYARLRVSGANHIDNLLYPIPPKVKPAIRIAKVSDGSESGAPIVFKVAYDNGPDGRPLDRAIVVQLKIDGGTATVGADYGVPPTQVIIPANKNEVIFRVSPMDDGVVEPSESMVLGIKDTDFAVYVLDSTRSTATGLIADNEPVLSLAVSSGTAKEGPAPSAMGELAVRSSIFLRSPLTVRVSLAGTATTGMDYAIKVVTGGVTSTLAIASGVGSFVIPASATNQVAKILVVPNDDSIGEGQETVTVTLMTGTGYGLGGESSGTVNIQDDEPVLNFTSSSSTASEDPTSPRIGEVIIGSNMAIKRPMTVHVAVSGTAVPGADYLLRVITGRETLSVVIASGVGSFVIPATAVQLNRLAVLQVTPLDDTEIESDESVLLSLNAGVGYWRGATSSGEITIEDNELILGFKSSSSMVSEDSDPPRVGELIIGSNTPVKRPVTLNFTVSGSAGIDADYQLKMVVGGVSSLVTVRSGSGSLSIPASATAQEVRLVVVPIDDAVGEPSEEVRVALVAGVGYAIGPRKIGTVTIQDNEPTLSFTSSAAIASESPVSPMVGELIIGSAGAIKHATTINFLVGGTASVDTDYALSVIVGGASSSVLITSGTGSLVIPPTVTQLSRLAVLRLTPIHDAIAEPHEFMTVTLNSGEGYTVGPLNSGTVTIQEDSEPTISFLSPTSAVSEAPVTSSLGELMIGIGTAVKESLILNVMVAGTATIDVDYILSVEVGGVTSPVVTSRGVGSLEIPESATSQKVRLLVTALNDDIAEGEEVVQVTLAAGTGYMIGSADSGTVTIHDDEPTLSLISSRAIASEDPLSPKVGELAVVSDHFLTQPVTVALRVEGSATLDVDYVLTTEIDGMRASFIAPLGVGALVFPPSVTSKEVKLMVTPIDDLLGEGEESVTVILMAGAGYVVGGTTSGTVSIHDDEPTLQFTSSSFTIDEDSVSAGGGELVIGSDRVIKRPIVVAMAVAGTATFEVDYILEVVAGGEVTPAVATSGVLTFSIPAKESGLDHVARLRVIPVDDRLREGSEIVTVMLTIGEGYALGAQSSGEVGILDDEMGVSVTTSIRSLNEPSSTAVVTVTGPKKTTYKISASGTATAGDDYSGLPVSVTLPDSESEMSSISFIVAVVNDGIHEEDESIRIDVTGEMRGASVDLTISDQVADSDGRLLADGGGGCGSGVGLAMILTGVFIGFRRRKSQ